MVSSSFQCIKQICHPLIIKRIGRIVIILFLYIPKSKSCSKINF